MCVNPAIDPKKFLEVNKILASKNRVDIGMSCFREFFETLFPSIFLF